MSEMSSSPEYYDAVDWEEESKKLKKDPMLPVSDNLDERVTELSQFGVRQS